MRVPVTESPNPLSMYGSVQPSPTSIAMAGATMAQLDQTKQKRNAAASTVSPGPKSGSNKRLGPKA
jgi:hypothetical protein